MAEFRFTSKMTGIDPAGLADNYAAISATVAAASTAQHGRAAELLADDPALRLLVGQGRVSARWTLDVGALTGSTTVAAPMDVRLLNLPSSLVGDNVAVLVAFASAMVSGMYGWLESDAGADVVELLDSDPSKLVFSNEFLSGVSLRSV